MTQFHENVFEVLLSVKENRDLYHVLKKTGALWKTVL